MIEVEFGMRWLKSKMCKLMKRFDVTSPNSTIYFKLLPYLQTSFKYKGWISHTRLLGNNWQIKSSMDGIETFS
jgi:hypothetical protein